MYDTIIIGSGPGWNDRRYFCCQERNVKAIIIGKDLGGQMVWAGEIENYPGIKKISGFEFNSKLSRASSFFWGGNKSADAKLKKPNKNTFWFILVQIPPF